MSATVEPKGRAWAQATSCKVPDNIVSSQFTSQKVFVPSYEKEKRPCMEQLLTNEYQRIWWQEKETWDRINSKKIGAKKLLQRMVIRKKPPAVPIPIKVKKVKKFGNKKDIGITKMSETTQQKEESPDQEKEETLKMTGEDKVKESA